LDQHKHADKAEREAKVDSGVRKTAGWLFVIGSLSILSKFMDGFGISFDFIFGLGAAQLIDMLLIKTGISSSIAFFFVSLFFNIIISSVFFVLATYAEKAQAWAFIISLIFYGVDLILVLILGKWFALIFHAVALYGIFFGYKSLRAVEYAIIREMIEHEKLKRDNPELYKMIKENPTLNKMYDD
jgi:hypothetical protein